MISKPAENVPENRIIIILFVGKNIQYWMDFVINKTKVYTKHTTFCTTFFTVVIVQLR